MTVNKLVTTREVVETRVVLDLSMEQAEHLYALLYDVLAVEFEESTDLLDVRIGLGKVCDRKYRISGALSPIRSWQLTMRDHG